MKIPLSKKYTVVIILIILFFYLNIIFLKKTQNKYFKTRASNKTLQKKLNYQISSRKQLGSLMEALKGKSFIEIGVQRGNFAFELLSNWPNFTNYYGIDPWQMQKNYLDTANVDNKIQEKLYQEVKKRLHKFGEKKIKLIREFSNKAVNYFEDFSIDLVYIDARHDFCSVLEDLQLYFPKVKCGGLIAGHDYLSVDEKKKISKKSDYSVCGNGTRILKYGGGVKGAVTDFFEKIKKTKIHVTKETWPTWYTFKQCS